jgi:hypothetical protein
VDKHRGAVCDRSSRPLLADAGRSARDGRQGSMKPDGRRRVRDNMGKTKSGIRITLTNEFSAI